MAPGGGNGIGKGTEVRGSEACRGSRGEAEYQESGLCSECWRAGAMPRGALDSRPERWTLSWEQGQPQGCEWQQEHPS